MFLLFQELVARVRAEATSIIDHWWSLTLKKKETKNEKHGVNDDVKNCSQKHRLLVVCSTKKKTSSDQTWLENFPTVWWFFSAINSINLCLVGGNLGKLPHFPKCSYDFFPCKPPFLAIFQASPRSLTLQSVTSMAGKSAKCCQTLWHNVPG